MRLLLIGAPGSGKGTQGARIAEIFDVEHIAAGDILRAHVADKTEIGRRISRYLEAGELVPDDEILKIIVPRMLAAAEAKGYVLDGFPRSVAQAAEARRIAETHDSQARRAIYLKAPEQELIDRLLRRAQLQGRADDTIEVIKSRLALFNEVTAPVLEFYRRGGLLNTVDATMEPERVTEAIIAALPPLAHAERV